VWAMPTTECRRCCGIRRSRGDVRSKRATGKGPSCVAQRLFSSSPSAPAAEAARPTR
jgi:hypothetical protein